MSVPEKFEGWLGLDPSSVEGNMKWGEFEPKKWEEDDVDIEISHCGICGSDLHTLQSGWTSTLYRTFTNPSSLINKRTRTRRDLKEELRGEIGLKEKEKSSY